jgi:hypothetical protein
MSGTDDLAELRKALAVAEAELASSVKRFEQVDSPDLIRNEINRAKVRVARAKAALAAKGPLQ